MILRPAKEEEMTEVKRLAEQFDLDSGEMPSREFIIAKENGQIAGFGRLKTYSGYFELCSLGVAKEFQRKKIGEKIARELIKRAGSKPVYLRTVIPGYFQKLNFRTITSGLPELTKDEEWCENCKNRNLCTVMKYEHP